MKKPVFTTFSDAESAELLAALVAASLPATGVCLTGIGSKIYAAHCSRHTLGNINITVEWSQAPTADQIATAQQIATANQS